MNEKDLQQLEGLIVKAHQSGKKETSDLVFSFKKDILDFKSDLKDVKSHLAQLNGKIAKHEARFSDQAVLNATTAEVLRNILEKIKPVEENSNYRLLTQGSISSFKWIAGIGGLAGLGAFLKVLLDI